MRGSMNAARSELRMDAVGASALAPLLSVDPAERIIVALDGMNPEQAMAFCAQVQGMRWVKVGLELFVQAGPEVVAQLRESGLRVFLDLKFHDIPATMAGACRRAAALGAELITVHACAIGLATHGGWRRPVALVAQLRLVRGSWHVLVVATTR